jgi:site-specific DNA recombinase
MRGRKTQVERQRIAVAYCRVSTREQATEGHSLAAQEARLKALAQAQGSTIDRLFVDAGCSGKNLKRQAVAELLAAIAEGEIKALYVSKLDRLCRSLEDLLAIVRLCGKHDVALISASESIDTGSPAGKMMLQMLGAFAEFERAQIAARISDVSFDLRTKGQVYCGNTPFGYTR